MHDSMGAPASALPQVLANLCRHACICPKMHVRVRACLCGQSCVHACVRNVCMSAAAGACVCMRTCVHVCMSAAACAHLCEFVCALVHVFGCACVRQHARVFLIHEPACASWSISLQIREGPRARASACTCARACTCSGVYARGACMSRMCACMWACVHVPVHMCMRAFVPVCMQLCMHLCVHVRTQAQAEVTVYTLTVHACRRRFCNGGLPCNSFLHLFVDGSLPPRICQCLKARPSPCIRPGRPVLPAGACHVSGNLEGGHASRRCTGEPC